MASKFAGEFDAFAFAYGVNPAVPSLQVVSGSPTSGSYTLTCYSGYGVTPDGINFGPLNLNGPILVGEGASSETVTPTAVSNTTPASYSTTLVTATFAYAHSIGDQVRSGSVGLQEAINFAAVYGGGNVIVDARWMQFGGTSAMIAAAVLPSNVTILDERFGGFLVGDLGPASVTQLTAPTALTTATATNGMITTATTGGAIPTASTYRLGISYVDAFGGETTLSTDTASTSTILTGATATNTITVTSPAALTGAVGYKVYMTAASGASLSEILYPVGNAAITGTAAGTANPSFAIGTPVTITAIITGTATVPAINGAYASTTIPGGGVQIRSYPPFPTLASVAASATGILGVVNFPAGFFNTLGRTVRVKGMGYATTNTTAGTLGFVQKVNSVPGVTSTTTYTATSGTTPAAATVVSFIFDVLYVTASVGTAGTLEVHGTVAFNIAGTAVTSPVQDIVIAASAAVNLTVQDQLQVCLVPVTTALTTTQLRQLTIEVIQ